MIKRIPLSFVMGLSLILLSSLVLTGWATQTPQLISILPGQISQVFNSALCFLLMGFTLCIPDTLPKIQVNFRRLVGIAVIVLTLLTLSQSVFHYTLGIDQWVVRATSDSFNPYPGRMGNTAAILLFMAGVVFTCWSYQSQKSIMMFSQLALLAMFLFGVLIAAGYCLQLEFLYQSNLFLRTSIYTAIDFILLSVGLWAVGLRATQFKFFDVSNEDKKILFVSVIILFMVALVSEMSGFSVFSKQSESVLKSNLHQSLVTRINLLNDSVRVATDGVNSVAENPRFQSLLLNYSAALRDDFDLLFSSSGYSAVKIFNNAGGVLYRYGHFSEPQNRMTQLQLSGMQTANLMWDKGWLMQLHKDLYYQHKKVGSLLVELPLANMNQSYMNVEKAGRSGELILCALHTTGYALCAPQTLTALPIKQSLMLKGSDTAMASALQGKSGDVVSIDEDNHVVFTAFSPIPALGLGVVVKIDTVDLYRPVRSQLAVIVPIFFLSLSIGMLLLSWQVLPLVRKIVVSEKKALNSNARLRESEGRFRSAFDSAAIGMSLVSLEGKWLRVNQSLCDILGYSEAELLSLHTQDLTYLDDIEDENMELQQLIQGEVQSVRLEKRFITKEDYILWALVTSSLVRDADNAPLYYISQIQNIDIQKHAEERLRELAYHDPLTGLDNRSEIEKNIDSALFAARVNHNGFALIFLDLDHFKEVNDNYGHDAGDALLREVARRLQGSVRRSDKVGRLGGDEFVVMLLDAGDVKTISVIAKKIIEALAEPIMLDDGQINITTSMGISIYPEDGLSMETLMKHADIALYCAKEFGKNNFQFFGGVKLQP